MSENEAGIDPRLVVAEIERDVSRRRAAGEYPVALLDRLRTEFRPDAATDPPETCAFIESSRPLRSDHRLAGRAIVFAKRAIRRSLSWYVAPIAADQSRFNLAILRDLRSLERRLEDLERRSATDRDNAGEPPPPPPGS